MLVVDGERLCLKDAVERIGAVSYSTATSRMERGWSAERAARTPAGKKHREPRTYPWEGEQLTIEQLADLSPVSRHTISRRLCKGWTLQRAVTEPAAR